MSELSQYLLERRATLQKTPQVVEFLNLESTPEVVEFQKITEILSKAVHKAFPEMHVTETPKLKHKEIPVAQTSETSKPENKLQIKKIAKAKKILKDITLNEDAKLILEFIKEKGEAKTAEIITFDNGQRSRSHIQNILTKLVASKTLSSPARGLYKMASQLPTADQVKLKYGIEDVKTYIESAKTFKLIDMATYFDKKLKRGSVDGYIQALVKNKFITRVSTGCYTIVK